jgi:Protein of unknown function (DUF1453)
MNDGAPHWLSIAMPAIIIPVVLFFRFRSMGKVRPFKPQWLWVIPTICTLAAIALYVALPPHGLTWLYAALALCAGSGLGWWRGKLTHIMVDPQTGDLSQKASPAAMIFIVVLIAARFASRSLLGGSSGNALHGPTMMVTDILVAFAVGFLVTQRLELYLRARRLQAVPTH